MSQKPVAKQNKQQKLHRIEKRTNDSIFSPSFTTPQITQFFLPISTILEREKQQALGDGSLLERPSPNSLLTKPYFYHPEFEKYRGKSPSINYT